MRMKAGKLPLTLALSPQAGRGREDGATGSFSPPVGRRWPAGRMRGIPPESES
jgi:hypothetical protein